MTIGAKNNSWDKSLGTLVVYILIGACGALWVERITPRTSLTLPLPYVIELLGRNSFHPNVSITYWTLMIYLFPLALAVFSAFSPLKINKRDASTSVWIGSFILFGLVAAPSLTFALFIDSQDFLMTRLGRMLLSTSRDLISLVYSGSIYFSMLLSVYWIAYYQIPRAFLTIRSANQAES